MRPLLLLGLLLPVAAYSGDDFNAILKRVESHYGKRHMKVPFMGLVTFASHFTRPLGASDLKIAIIEGADRGLGRMPDFEPGPEWHAFIRTTSRNGEHTVMYGREEGSAVRTLMLVVDRDETVVMHMRLDGARFAKFVAEKSNR